MTKNLLLRAGTGVALVCVAALTVTVSGQNASSVGRDGLHGMVEAAREFFEEWLLARDIDRAREWFSDVAYRHASFLDADCNGFSEAELGTEARRRAALRAFLRDGIPDDVSKSLVDVVSPRGTARLANRLGKRVVNEPSRDHFVVTTMDPDDRSLRGARNEELRQVLPPTFHVALLSFDGGELYFFWLKEDTRWRIVHANITCV